MLRLKPQRKAARSFATPHVEGREKRTRRGGRRTRSSSKILVKPNKTAESTESSDRPERSHPGEKTRPARSRKKKRNKSGKERYGENQRTSQRDILEEETRRSQPRPESGSSYLQRTALTSGTLPRHMRACSPGSPLRPPVRRSTLWSRHFTDSPSPSIKTPRYPIEPTFRSLWTLFSI